MSDIVQMVITRVEEPVDAPRGEVFKLTLFNNKTVEDSWHYNTVGDLLDAIRDWVGELRSA